MSTPQRRASDRRLPARAWHLVLRGWHAWTSHSRETISPGAALWLTLITVLLFAQNHEVSSLSTRTNDALCTLRGDLVVRVRNSDRLLKDNPGLLKRFGLTAAQVKQSRSGQVRTIRALRELQCDKDAPRLAAGVILLLP